jgi:hypothetical protein
MDLKEIEWEGVQCTYHSEDRDKWPAVVNTVMNLLAPQSASSVFTG